MSSPILVTGSHRSGTTWAGRMLSLRDDVGYIHEPLNPRRRPGWSGTKIPYWFVYITDDDDHYYRPIVEDILSYRYPIADNVTALRGPKQIAMLAKDLRDAWSARRHDARPLVKDPFALFSAEWFARRFDADVVVMIRHPAAFASSIKRLNWRFKFKSWLAQEALLRDRLAAYERAMRRCATDDVDVIDEAIVMWNAMHEMIRDYRANHPGWSFVRHEDLARAPEQGFRALYDKLRLGWTPEVQTVIDAYTSEHNPKEVSTWRHQSVRRDSRAATASWRRRLTPEEIDRLRDGTAGIYEDFYGDHEW